MDFVTVIILIFIGIWLIGNWNNILPKPQNKQPTIPRPYTPPVFSVDTSLRFQTFSTDGSTCYYLWDYYPKNRFPNISGESDDHRRTVWNFKDGYSYSTVADKISSALINQFGKSQLASKTLCIIPASTSDKTSKRFTSFCSTVSSSTGIINGYNLLSSASNRPTTHLGQGRNINHSDYISFGDVYGRDILLFDDVITSGNSFKNVKSALLNRGARSVTGIFLAKTVSSVYVYDDIY